MERVADYILKIPELSDIEICSDLQDDSLESGMGSKVSPYFILHAERITDPRLPDPPAVVSVSQRNPHDKTPPMTPAPSSNTEEQQEKLRSSSKKPTRAVIFESKRSETMKRKMDIIRERLEKSRERYEERKRLQENSDMRCEPTVIGLTEKGDLPHPINRSVSDLTSLTGSQKRANGSFPYVYFVVAEDKVVEEDDTEEDVKQPTKRKTYTSERSKKKKDIDDRASKLQGIARELGLKSSPMKPIPFSSRPPTRPSISHTAFPSSLPSPPPRMPPGTPAVNAFSLDRGDALPFEMDDPLFRRYPTSTNGFRKPRINSYSMQTFELPFISMEQQTKSLGISARNHKFTENFLYKHQLDSQRNRKVPFAEALPVIRGSGFVIGDIDTKNKLLPGLGPRAATLGSITLNSENPSKNVKELCQRLRLSESIDTNRVKKLGAVPLSLPRIDIVSSVYDEMVIKMIYNYMNDANTPSRQAQLAKELLHHLQQNNAKEAQTAADALIKAQENDINRASTATRKTLDTIATDQSRAKSSNAVQPLEDNTERQGVPPTPADQHKPNTLHVEDDNIPMSSDDEAFAKEPVITVTLRSKEHTGQERDEHKPKSVPVPEPEPVPVPKPVAVAIKPEEKPINGMVPLEPTTLSLDCELTDMNNQTTKPPTAKKSKDKPEYNAVSPTSFKMAPPGLSREDTNISIKLNS